ncbi:MAG TPA: hypothetical protein VNT02_15625, partial [Burkholderiales bacterium]|nr:hypothetical protein [Burkholderiales bacterium]
MGGMHGEVVSAQQSLRPGGRREITAWLSLALIALMWSLPFLQPVHHYPLPAFYSEWLAFVLGLAAMCLLAGKRAWAHGEFPAIACAPLALATLILLQAAFGKVPYSGQAIAAALYLVWAAALIVVACELKRRIGLETVAAILACALVLGGLLTAAAGAVQYF